MRSRARARPSSPSAARSATWPLSVRPLMSQVAASRSSSITRMRMRSLFPGSVSAAWWGFAINCMVALRGKGLKILEADRGSRFGLPPRPERHTRAGDLCNALGRARDAIRSALVGGQSHIALAVAGADEHHHPLVRLLHSGERLL